MKNIWRWTFILSTSSIDILTNYGEYINDADPFSNDTDKDNLYDFFELGITTTYVNKYDSDNDGISDANEDFDDDGLINLDEQYWRTDPWFKRYRFGWY